MSLTRLIKWVGLELTYVVLYLYLDSNRTQYATFMTNNFLYDLETQYKINEL
jgi:hypothetical protein